MKSVPIRIDGEQKPLDYYVVRVQLVHARRQSFFKNWIDTVLTECSAIPDTRLEATKLAEELRLILLKHGVEVLKE